MTPTELPAPVWRWGAPDAPAFVMLHSLGLDGGSFRWVAEAMLARSDVQIIAPDLRGHGKARTPPSAITLEGMAADVVRLLPTLGIARAHLLGTSMGSAVARLAVAQAPSQWRGVTLVAGGPAAVPALAERGDAALRAGMQAVVEGTLERWFSPGAIAADDGCVRYARACLMGMDPASWAAAWRALATYPAPGPLPEGVPGLCVAGDLDVSATVPVVEAMRAAASVRPPVVRVPGAPHQLTMTHAPAVAELLLSNWGTQGDPI